MSKDPDGKFSATTFTRESTGLVKAASPWQAALWNVANVMGSKFPWSVARLGIFPVALILGTSPYLWAMLLVGLASYVLAIIYVQITSAIPRSGADYVTPSRLLGPFWGWLVSWMLVCSFIPVWGYVTWVTLRNVKQLIDILRIGGMTTLDVPWILKGTPAFVLGIIVILSAAGMCFLPAKRYYKLVGAIVGAALASLVVTALATAMISPSVFDANFQRLVGLSSTSVVQTALKNGYEPNGRLGLAGTAELVGLALFGISGFQFSATISAELKGDNKRSLSISILGSLTLFIVCFVGIVWLMLARFNYDLVVGWSYLFWNGIPGAPFKLPPINALLLTIGFPELAPIWAIVGVSVLVGGWMIVPASMIYINRLVISWGMDRMVPSALFEVNPRYGQPLKLVIVEAILAMFFFALTLLNLNPITYLWWGALLLFPSYLFPALCALSLPRKRPDLMQYVPWRNWLKPLAILWIIIIVPVYAFAVLIGSFPAQPTETAMWRYALSSGLIITAAVIMIGILTFIVVRVINVRRGIDVDLIFKEIPPE